MSTNPHNDWLKAEKRWDLLTALADKDLALKAWAETADVDLKTLLKHRDELLREDVVERYLNREDGITYYHLKSGAALARASVASPSEAEYIVRQTEDPESREIPFNGKIPADGNTIHKGDNVRSSIVIGRPYWRVYGERKLAEFRNENGWPTLTSEEIEQWVSELGETAEFTVGPARHGKVPSPGLKQRA